MKKLYTLLFSLFFAGGVFAQTSFSAAQETLVINGDASMSDFYDQIDLANETGLFLKLDWERVKNDLPTGWETSICDKSTCYPPSKNSEELIFGAWGNNYINIHFYPNNVDGTGYADVLISNPADPTDEVTLHFIGTTVALSVEEELAEGITLYPNPAQSAVHIQTSVTRTQFVSWQLLDLSGKELASGIPGQSGQEFSVNTAGLESGIYFVKLTTLSGEALTKKFFRN